MGTGREDLCCWGRRVQSFSASGKRAPVCGVIVVSPWKCQPLEVLNSGARWLRLFRKCPKTCGWQQE